QKCHHTGQSLHCKSPRRRPALALLLRCCFEPLGGCMPPRKPRLKTIRRLGTPLPGLTRKEPDWKTYPPGQHGPTGRRRKASTYKTRLEEKQKVRYNYGVSERQLRRYFDRALKEQGPTGENLLALL